MKASHTRYARAREKLLTAQAAQPAPFRQDQGEELPPEVQAVADAEIELRTAADAVIGEMQAAWDRNRQAVAHAKTAIVEARNQQARVEVAAGTAARSRDPRHPVLNEDERAAVTEARAQVDVAVAAHAEALAAFKDGVTVEQLEVTGAV